MPETVGFACALSKILERSKSITVVLNIVPGFQIENFGSERLILVLELEQIVPIRQHCSGTRRGARAWGAVLPLAFHWDGSEVKRVLCSRL